MTTHRSPQSGKPPSDAGLELQLGATAGGVGRVFFPSPSTRRTFLEENGCRELGGCPTSPSSEGWSPRKFVPPPHPQPRTVSTAELP